ncbi:MAG: DUF3149 domain-containing protein [Planctomycetes bacterium]|nr:DUF3149 domain-containing protein [Planctomycetota bacterium]
MVACYLRRDRFGLMIMIVIVIVFSLIVVCIRYYCRL